MAATVATVDHRGGKTGASIPSRRRGVESPFYSRAYGGFTAEQMQFCLSQLGNPEGKIVLDPMAGQGFLLTELAYRGARVWLGDLNPALCLLASLRDPKLVQQCDESVRWVEDILGRIQLSGGDNEGRHYVDRWVPASIQHELEAYRDLIGLPRHHSPFNDDTSFWRAPIRKRLAAVLPVLAARELACFRLSDNKTWPKQGGLQREDHILEPIQRALVTWTIYAKQLSDRFPPRRTLGRLNVQRMNVELGIFGNTPIADAIVTSPPYANRLDYTRMWAPELEVLAAMWAGDVATIQSNQIGSNVVRGRHGSNGEEARLPRAVVKALETIKSDQGSYASERYYYPFFRNYALSLARSVDSLALRLAPGGVFVIFVRDTARKDVLFPTAELVKGMLARQGLRLVAKDRRIVRRHVGLLRRGSANGLYGIGQQEWWLAFRKAK